MDINFESLGPTAPFKAHTMSTLRCRLGAVVCVLSVFAAPCLVIGGEPSLQISLVIGQTEVSPFDPIYAKATITNETDDPIRGTFDFTVEAGTVIIELRPRGSESFQRIPLRFENALLEPSEASRVRIPARGKVATYILISESPKRRMFEVGGDYEVRALVKHPDGHSAHSGPIALNVRSLDDHSEEAAAKASILFLRALTMGGVPDSLGSATFVDSARSLGDSKLRATLTTLGVVTSIRDADSQEALSEARNSIEELRTKVPQVEKEWLALILARQYLAIDRPDLAVAESRHMDPASVERAEIVRVSREKARSVAPQTQ